MPLVLVGLSHPYTPVAVRERFSCADEMLPTALTSLVAYPRITEAAILSTCNRVELYACVDGANETAFDLLTQHLSTFHGVPRETFRAHLECKADGEAVTHLLRVAGGLESQVLGEGQILGQVRQAMQSAQESRTVGPTLTAMFQAALASGKRIQSETGLGGGSRSIAGVAVGFASRIFDLRRASALLLGAGETGELAARHLIQNGVQRITVANRTYDRAVALAEQLGGRAIPFDAFPSELASTDIVIASTAAPHLIVTRETLLPILKKRRGRPLFLIDIAIPRDIAPEVGDLEDVFLYNIGDLEQAVAEEAGTRAGEITRAEAIVAEEVGKFLVWYQARKAAPVIRQLQSRLDTLTEERLAILRRQLGPMSERDWNKIEEQMRALSASIAREPILQLKAEAASGTNAFDEEAQSGTTIQYDLAGATQALFGLTASEEWKRPALETAGTAATFGSEPQSGPLRLSGEEVGARATEREARR